MKKPFFSIVVPAYNSQDSILPCLDSVLNQNFEDYEILTIDDGSTDLTAEKIKTISNKKVKYFHKKNGGVSSARNYGLKKATGDWVIFLDADDTLAEGSLSDLSRIIQKNNADYIISPIKTVKPIDKNKHIPHGKASRLNKTDAVNGMIFNVSSSPLYIPRGIGGKIIRRKIIEDNKILFDERLKIFEDGIFNLHVSSHANEIIFYNTTIYEYDRSNKQSRSNTFYPGVINDNKIIFETIKEILNGMNYSSPTFPYLCLELLHNSILAVSKETIKTSQKIRKIKQLKALYLEKNAGTIRLKEAYKTLKVVYILCRARAYRLLLLFYRQLFKSLKRRNRA